MNSWKLNSDRVFDILGVKMEFLKKNYYLLKIYTKIFVEEKICPRFASKLQRRVDVEGIQIKQDWISSDNLKTDNRIYRDSHTIFLNGLSIKYYVNLLQFFVFRQDFWFFFLILERINMEEE